MAKHRTHAGAPRSSAACSARVPEGRVRAVRPRRDRRRRAGADAGPRRHSRRSGCRRSTGVDVITDGEVRRQVLVRPAHREPVGLQPGRFRRRCPFTRGAERAVRDRHRVLPVGHRDAGHAHSNLPHRSTRFVRDQHAHSPTKATIAGMTYASVLYVPGLSDTVYPDRDAYMADALRLMREVVRREVVDAGATLRAARLAALHAHGQRGGPGEPAAGRARHVDLARADDRDGQRADPVSARDVTFAVHLCRGNHRSMWSVEGGYDAIAEQLFNDLAVDRILAEYDSPRAGTFEPLRFVPEDKTVVLGLITTKEPELEDADQLNGRIEEASRIVPLDRLASVPAVRVRVDAAGQPGHVRGPAREAATCWCAWPATSGAERRAQPDGASSDPSARSRDRERGVRCRDAGVDGRVQEHLGDLLRRDAVDGSRPGRASRSRSPHRGPRAARA